MKNQTLKQLTVLAIAFLTLSSCNKDDDGTKTVNTPTNDNLIEVGENFTDPRDKTVYPTVKIGKQIWMSKNLSYKLADKSWAYNDDETKVDTYGRLYLWEALKDAIPAGWHLPTDEEWKTLEKTLGMTETDLNKIGYEIERGTNQGTQLKAGGKAKLNFPAAGFRRDDGKFEGIDGTERARTYLWINTEINTNGEKQVYRRRIEKEQPFVYRFTNPTAGFAISVRLIKD